MQDLKGRLDKEDDVITASINNELRSFNLKQDKEKEKVILEVVSNQYFSLLLFLLLFLLLLLLLLLLSWHRH